MKGNSIQIIFFTGIILMFTTLDSRGQGVGLDGFSIRVNPGSMVYYGDLSTNNLNLPKRLATNSKFGVSTGIIKQFSPFFGIQAQFAAGSLYNSAADNTYFAGSLTEFSLSARFDPIKLVKNRNFSISPYFSIGVASFGYRSVRRVQDTNLVLLPNFGYNPDGVTNSRKETAMSMPLALGISYKILPYLNLELEHSLRLTNTDLLDCFKGQGTANDLYSITSIGVRYAIPSRSGRNAASATESIPFLPVKKDRSAEAANSATQEMNIFVDCDIPEIVKAGETVDVKLRINKGPYTGPAKITQKLPAGFSAIENSKYTNSFLFSPPNVIIEWRQIPADSSVTYDYRIEAGKLVNGSQTITGRFEFYEAGGTRTIRFNKTIYVDNLAALEGKAVAETRNEPEVIQGTRGNIRPAQAKPGIEFRIQCGAFRENNQADVDLAAKHRITEVIQEEYTDGWYKYTVGSFTSYEEAARYRDSFIERTGILSCFLVAYRDGRRLANISEALK
jgi:hypothetical protein